MARGSLGILLAAAAACSGSSIFSEVAHVGKGRIGGRAVAPYYIDTAAVTNEAFRAFVRAHKQDGRPFKTEAERFGWSFVMKAVVPPATLAGTNETLPEADWWVPVQGAWWREPEGPGTSVQGRLDHPATHVSLEDATEFCRWRKGKLPSSAQWEWAARAGKEGGDDLPWAGGEEAAAQRANLWTGAFPAGNDEADGFTALAPVRQYGAQNSWGFYNMLGNCWEWTRTPYTGQQKAAPRGAKPPQQWTLHGGSFVDTIDGSSNHRVTLGTTMGNAADAGSNNLCFRCAYRFAPEDAPTVELAPDDEL